MTSSWMVYQLTFDVLCVGGSDSQGRVQNPAIVHNLVKSGYVFCSFDCCDIVFGFF